MFDLDTHFVFPTHAVAPPGPLPARAVRLSFDTPSGATLHGVHIPPAVRQRGETILVLVFAGNAWNSEDAVDYVAQVYPRADVVGFHYRGYRPSTGKPSAQALMEDAPAVYDHAVELCRPDKVVAVGLSIGSGVAANLSRQRRLDGLILVTPFDSLKKVAEDAVPMLPIGWMFRHEMNAADALKASAVPTAIIAAESDLVVPSARTEALRQSTGKLVYDRTIRRADHNDIYRRSDFHGAMRAALRAVTH